jgi:hypothetical protein
MDMNAAMNELTAALEAMDPGILAAGIYFWIVVFAVIAMIGMVRYLLKAIGYKGEMVLEAHHQSLDAKDEDREDILKEIYRRADKMREYFLK